MSPSAQTTPMMAVTIVAFVLLLRSDRLAAAIGERIGAVASAIGRRLHHDLGSRHGGFLFFLPCPPLHFFQGGAHGFYSGLPLLALGLQLRHLESD